MNKIITSIEHVAVAAAEDTVKVVTYLPKQLLKVEHVIAAAIKDEPVVRTAVLNLVAKAQGVIGDVSVDVATKGIDLQADLQTLHDAEAFFEYFRTSFLPVLEAAFKDLKTGADAQ